MKVAEMTKESKKILDSYKKNLDNFIELNKLDKELVSDIEERIYDKIELEQELTPEKLKNILKEIGSPEEIFKEQLWENVEKVPSNFWEKIKQKSEKVIFLWVFYELWLKTGISANIYRILFFILFLIWIFASAKIIPVLIVFYIIGFLLIRTGFFRFIFSGIIWIICFSLLIPAIIILGLYTSNFHIENIYIFKDFSYMLPIWLFIWIFALILLWTTFLIYAFSWKFLTKIFFTWTISFLIALTLGFWVISELFGRYYWIQSEEKNISIDIKNLKFLNLYNTKIKPVIHSDFINLQENLNFYNIWFSNNDKINLTIEKNTISSKENYEKYKNFIKNFDLKIKDNNFSLNLEYDFSNKYPLIPTFFEIKNIKIPANIRFNSYYWNLSEKRINFPEKEKHKNLEWYIFKMCEKYFYDKDWNLNCDLTKEEIEKISKNYPYKN